MPGEEHWGGPCGWSGISEREGLTEGKEVTEHVVQGPVGPSAREGQAEQRCAHLVLTGALWWL